MGISASTHASDLGLPLSPPAQLCHPHPPAGLDTFPHKRDKERTHEVTPTLSAVSLFYVRCFNLLLSFFPQQDLIKSNSVCGRF